MYRTDLNNRDKGGAIAAVVAIHAGLAFAFLHMSGTIDFADPAAGAPGLRRDRDQAAAAAAASGAESRCQKQKPKAKEGAASPKNIKSEATPVVAPKPQDRAARPRPRSRSPKRRARARLRPRARRTCAGREPGAGGIGTGTGSGGAGSGPGGGGRWRHVEPPRLLTPVLRGRDFPRGLLDSWPRGAQSSCGSGSTPGGRIIQCVVDRGTGNPHDRFTSFAGLTQLRFRFRPAFNRYGQAVAGWAGYRQTPPQLTQTRGAPRPMIEAEWWEYDSVEEMADAVAGDVGFIVESALDARDSALIALPGGDDAEADLSQDRRAQLAVEAGDDHPDRRPAGADGQRAQQHPRHRPGVPAGRRAGVSDRDDDRRLSAGRQRRRRAAAGSVVAARPGLARHGRGRAHRLDLRRPRPAGRARRAQGPPRGRRDARSRCRPMRRCRA